jgi:transposase-like protein
MSLNNNTNRSRPAAVRALRRLSKAEALDQFRLRPAASVSAAARQWGCSRSTARLWIAEFTAPPVATASPPPAAMATPPSPAEVVKAALSALCDSLEFITPEALVDSADDVDIGLHGDCQMAAARLATVELLAGAALKRRAR